MSGRLRPPVVVVAATLACIAALWAATASTYFFADDWLVFGRARELGFGLELLRTTYFGNFAPGHRLLDYVVVTASDASWALARALLLAFYAGAAAAFFALMRELRVAPALAAAATAMFAASVAFGRLLQWWANGAHVVPSVFFSLLVLWLGVRWMRTRGPALLVAAAAAETAALLFYSKPVLCPVYLLLLRVLVIGDEARLADAIRGARRDLPLWIAMAVPLAMYALVLRSDAYGAPGGQAPLGQWAEYAARTWLDAIAPMFIAQSVPVEASALNQVARVVAQVSVAALVAVSVLTRSGAWRAWAFFAAAAAGNVALVGLGRLHVFGPTIANDLRYSAEFAFLIPLTLALAFSAPRRAGRRARRYGRRTAQAVTALAVLAYAASYAGTLDRIADGWEGAAADDAVARYERSVARLRAEGRDPVVLDGPAPYVLVGPSAVPYDRVSTVLAEVDPDREFDAPSPAAAFMASDGSLVAPAPAPAASISGGDPALGASEGAATVGDARCVAGPGSFSWVPDTDVADIAALEVEVDPRPDARRLLAFVDHGAGTDGEPGQGISIVPGAATGLAGIGRDIVSIRLDVPPGAVACVRRMSLLHPAGGR